MYENLDVDNWNRKDQFHFFKNYDNPFFNLCSELDVTVLVKFVKDQQLSFFSASLFLSLRAANEIQQFRYRIRGEKVIIHDVVHAGSTVLNDDHETFSFCYFDYLPDFQQFNDHVSQKLKNNQARGGKLDPQDFRDDMIHYSVIPWIVFTSVSHPRKFHQVDSIPKIVFGKYHKVGDQFRMPISVEGHHALMDGIHVARFLSLYQDYVNEAGRLLQIE